MALTSIEDPQRRAAPPKGFALFALGFRPFFVGAGLAAVLLIGLPEWFRDLGTYRMLAFGLAMVLIMVFRPRGLIAHRAPTVRLHAKAGGDG